MIAATIGIHDFQPDMLALLERDPRITLSRASASIQHGMGRKCSFPRIARVIFFFFQIQGRRVQRLGVGTRTLGISPAFNGRNFQGNVVNVGLHDGLMMIVAADVSFGFVWGVLRFMLGAVQIQGNHGMRVALTVIAWVSLIVFPAALSAGTGSMGMHSSVGSAEVMESAPGTGVVLASVLQRADCNMTCEGDCCTETCCGPDGCETCKTCCPDGDCNKYCYEHKKGKKPAPKK